MGDEEREICDIALCCLINGHRCRGRSRLEADAEENDFLVRIVLRDLESVQRAVHDADISATRFYGQQIGSTSGNAQHITKGTKDHPRPGGDFERLIDQLDRRNTDGATRSVNELDSL